SSLRSRHFCQLHNDSRAMTESVLAYVRTGLLSGNAVMVIAGKSRLNAILRALAQDGSDIEKHLCTQLLTLLDADEFLPLIMKDELPDREAFMTSIGVLLRDVQIRGHGSTRVYGELVNLLWSQGNARAAIRVEDYWNELMVHHEISLYCGYEIHAFNPGSYETPLKEIARCHSDIIQSDDDRHLLEAINKACQEVLGNSLASTLRNIGREEYGNRLPAPHRVMFWLQRNIPSSVDKVLARARYHYEFPRLIPDANAREH
ncbi:MAG: MEDS domain-containing protein, partial [Pseudohongiellaceae bacterium]